jgi:ribosomal protein S19
MVILPEFVDNVIGIWNGRTFVEIAVKPEMIGHALGEFAPSKKLGRESKPAVGAIQSWSGTGLK